MTSFKDKHTAAWLLEHPGIINKAFFDAAPMSEAWIQEAIKDSKLPSFTKKNADHYLKVRAYIFWMYPQCLSELLEGKKTVDVFTELMNASNVFNFPYNTINRIYENRSNILKKIDSIILNIIESNRLIALVTYKL